MHNLSTSSSILGIVVLLSIGGCNPAVTDGDSSSSSGSTEPQDAVVIQDPNVPGNLLIIAHDPGNSCDNPYGDTMPLSSHTMVQISLAPALQAIGKYPVCDISNRMAQACSDGSQCTSSSSDQAGGDATFEITSIDASQVTYTLTGIENCSWGPFGVGTPQALNGTYTAPRCD